MIALLMMTSSVSVVDSTFSATARLIGLQLMGYFQKGRVLKAEETDWKNIMGGRIAIFVLAIIGTLM